MIRILSKNDQVLIAGIGASGVTIDPDGVLLNLDIDDFDIIDIDLDDGKVVQIRSLSTVTYDLEISRLIKT
jgi:hypothetical protein